MPGSPFRQLVAESIGTAVLAAAVVGSGIMATRLFEAQSGLALLANALATSGVLVALIVTLRPISGAHFNPLVSAVSAVVGESGWLTAAARAGAQSAGAIVGVMVSHAMFGMALLQTSAHARTGVAQWLSEAVASFGLVLVVRLAPPAQVASAVGLYILGAYWFTASTSFANPALTAARAMTATFAGIRPSDVAPFIAAQVIGALSAALLAQWITSESHA